MSPRAVLLTAALAALMVFAATAAAAPPWAFEETFDHDPTAPSTELLPETFDYTATHRTHPRSPDGTEPDGSYGSFPADHGADCSPPPNQHTVTTGHRSTSRDPDKSFFVCKNHMMSSMGHVEGYSVSAFWPRQEFDFSDGGTLEWEVNINDGHFRSWQEVMIVPRDGVHLAPAQDFFPIDETYPARRLLFQIDPQTRRWMHAGNVEPPAAPLAEAEQDQWRFPFVHGGDPALDDRKVRRTNRVTIRGNTVTWGLETADGTFDNITMTVPGGLPFTRGVVLFKTHAYTPEKDDNLNVYTYHWDNIRFDGPVLEPYEVSERSEVVNLGANGDKPIGSSETHTLTLPAGVENPILAAQINNPKRGQVKVDINGRGSVTLEPSYGFSDARCSHSGWATTQAKIDPKWLVAGENTLVWTVAPGDCSDDVWDGYAAKGVEIQYNGAPLPPAPGGTGAPAGSAGPTSLPGCAPVPASPAGGGGGTLKLTADQLRINQRIGAAAIRRANAIQAWLDAGIVGTDICAGSLEARNLGTGTTTTQGAGLPTGAPARPRALDIPPGKSKSAARFEVSARQLEINQKIYSAAVRRANALRDRIEGNLSGGDIRRGSLGRDRLRSTVGIASLGSGPAPPKSRTRIAAAKGTSARFERSVAQLRTNQKIAQAAVRRTNLLRQLLGRGLTGDNFLDGTLPASAWSS